MKRKPRRPATGTGIKQPWALAPFRSRGQFSPRLLLAWIFSFELIRVVEKWLDFAPAVVNQIVLPEKSVDIVLGTLAALIAALLSLGTLQKIQLTKPTPDTADDLNEEPVAEPGDAIDYHTPPAERNPPPAAD